MRQVRDELGPYRIVRKIAVGGMAEIYLARQRGIEGLERTVVLKQILEKHEQSEEFVTMFLDEARLMAALSHPNIAQVLDLARADDTHYLVMEYVRGPTLGAILAASQRAGTPGIPEKPALGIALAIAEALHYVHERRDDLGRPLGIVHRDLNPANVLVSYEGAVKLIDFGIAKAATKVYETRTGVIKGTYGYIAPEALTGSAQVDRRADVFALGILLYEMLIGKHPFDVSDEPSQLDRILEARYKRPREVRPDVPVALDRLISECLAPHPQGRPASMRDLIDALADHMARAGIVPTELDLGALVAQRVPDAEGPQPLRRPTSMKPRPLFPREAPAKDGGTRKVGGSASTPAEGAPTRRSFPRLPDEDEDPGTRKVAVPAGGFALDAPTETDPPPMTISEVDTFVRLTPVTPDELAWAADPEDEHGLTVPATSRISAPSGEPTLRIAPTEPRRGIHAALGGLGLVLAGVVAFAAARVVGAREPDPELAIVPAASPAIPMEVQVSPEIPRALTVISDPPGATISVDGVDSGIRTPGVITIDPRVSSVVLGVALEGHAPQSRVVSTSVRDARFVFSGD